MINRLGLVVTLASLAWISGIRERLRLMMWRGLWLLTKHCLELSHPHEIHE
jgi:hypothetical protein